MANHSQSALPLVDSALLSAAKAFLLERISARPRLAIILGSGLGQFAESLSRSQVIATATIPGYPPSTVAGHAGRWVFGTAAGRNILAVQGRVHAYEGYTISSVGFPVHLMAEVGINRLIVTNASGGLNLQFNAGDLMLIDDHINLMFANPLRGQHRKEWGERWPDMHAPYDPEFQKTALEVADELMIPLRRGVLCGGKGPSYETAAEVRMARLLGADALTMSTVPEVLVAVSRHMRILGLSCVTNMATGLTPHKLDHLEVTETANRISERFTQLLNGIIKKLA